LSYLDKIAQKNNSADGVVMVFGLVFRSNSMSSVVIERSNLNVQSANLNRTEAIKIIAIALGANEVSADKLVHLIVIKNCPARSALKASFGWGIWEDFGGQISSMINSIVSYEDDGIPVDELERMMWDFFVKYRESTSKTGGQSHFGIYSTRFKNSLQSLASA